MAATQKELQDLARAKWQSSGLSDAQAKKLRFEVLTADRVAALAPNFEAAGALKMPYFDAKGKPTKFFRIRYLETLPGFAGVVAKPQRYAQGAGSLNEVYAPPLLDRPWADVLTDRETGIVITEGELKAACACANGLATLGLGGVDVWRSSKRGLEMLEMLYDVDWEERNVCLFFDSDAAQNENVVRALRQLAHALTDRGAMPRIASLPGGPKGEKVGLDDFIVANSIEEVRALIETAPPWNEAAALWEMNEAVVYIRNPGLVLVRETSQRLAARDFAAHSTFATRHYTEQTEQGPKPRATAKKWVEWPERFELERITYRPGSLTIVDDEWNTWPGWNTQPKAGNLKPWKELFDFLLDGATREARTWFEQWLAYPLQHPGTKMFSAAVFWGVETGTGKSLVGETMIRIYGKNGVEIGDADLDTPFNEWVVDKQFIMGDEVTGDDKREKADKLKRLITQPRVRINAKYVPAYYVPDCVNYYFTSNHPDAFFLEDADRRYFIHEVIGRALPDSFYEEYDRWLNGTGPAHLFHYLLRVPLDGFNPKARPPMTSAKRAMIRDNKSDVGAWVLSLKETPEQQLRAYNMKAAQECALFTSAQLLKAYDPTGTTKVSEGGLARILKSNGIKQVNKGEQVRCITGQYRLFAVRDIETWVRAPAATCANHWNQFFGPRGAKY